MCLPRPLRMKDLSTLTTKELVDFFNSFDWFLSDLDGVVWNITEPITGADEAIKSLKKIGKRVIFVTNNTTRSLETQTALFKKRGFDGTDEIVTPILSTVHNLQKRVPPGSKVFVLGMSPIKQAIETSGFQIVENGFERASTFEEHTALVLGEEDVAAVVADVDMNCSYLNLQKAANFLRKSEVVFFKGATDVRGPVGDNRVFIAPGVFTLILERMTKREGLSMGKSGSYLNEYIVEKYGIKDKKRVLFVGDSVPEDMGFAAICGYKKLLVLSGLTSRDEVENWGFKEELKPDFYVESLKVVNDLISKVFGSR